MYKSREKYNFAKVWNVRRAIFFSWNVTKHLKNSYKSWKKNESITWLFIGQFFVTNFIITFRLWYRWISSDFRDILKHEKVVDDTFSETFLFQGKFFTAYRIPVMKILASSRHCRVSWYPNILITFAYFTLVRPLPEGNVSDCVLSLNSFRLKELKKRRWPNVSKLSNV